MEVSADGDFSNIDPRTFFPCAIGPTQEWQLVPFDNNLGQRNVAPVAGTGLQGEQSGASGLAITAEENEEPTRVANERPISLLKGRLKAEEPAEGSFDIESKTWGILLSLTLLGDKFCHAVSPPREEQCAPVSSLHCSHSHRSQQSLETSSSGSGFYEPQRFVASVFPRLSTSPC